MIGQPIHVIQPTSISTQPRVNILPIRTMNPGNITKAPPGFSVVQGGVGNKNLLMRSPTTSEGHQVISITTNTTSLLAGSESVSAVAKSGSPHNVVISNAAGKMTPEVRG